MYSVLALVLSVVVAAVAIGDDDKGFFSMGQPSFQPIATPLFSNSFDFSRTLGDGDEGNRMTQMPFGGAGIMSGVGSPMFFGEEFGGGFGDFNGGLRGGIDNDEFNFRSAVPVQRKVIPTTYSGYYGFNEDNDDFQRRYYSPYAYIPGASFGPRMATAGPSVNVRMTNTVLPRTTIVSPQIRRPSPFVGFRRQTGVPMTPMMGALPQFRRSTLPFQRGMPSGSSRHTMARHMAMKQQMMMRHMALKYRIMMRRQMMRVPMWGMMPPQMTGAPMMPMPPMPMMRRF